ncbi:hypothetical protein H7J07_05665 [Mycobacterium koreense]|uniref:Uncharacterized protein n=1 Tax=Mycolicibacillus koreensis TaxID=1069220 RepID=A0A7I7SB28_9MYCO|nr:hypothetical protein [Mycolicibacillus koreensis]MCV7247712.1 hypothetical protein [Mycolicibacillus koreensis]OSC34755.1 hypothetical protein B8W67_05775 [Mycolicibacillus koreensis]BBY54097.1 hypothetical protein MKOR_13480 [Mycolicibacillus koreensis]
MCTDDTELAAGDDAPTGRHARCEAVTDIGAIARNGGGQCTKVAGHDGDHRNSIGLTWYPGRPDS